VTPPTTLHERIAAELDRRTAVAKAATPGPWEMRNSEIWWVSRLDSEDVVIDAIGPESDPQTEPNAIYFVEHDPADALRRYAGELEVLERHAPCACDLAAAGRYPHCRTHRCLAEEGHRCAEIRSLASRLGVSVDG
jgi:hypothetical protein